LLRRPVLPAISGLGVAILLAVTCLRVAVLLTIALLTIALLTIALLTIALLTIALLTIALLTIAIGPGLSIILEELAKTASLTGKHPIVILAEDRAAGPQDKQRQGGETDQPFHYMTPLFPSKASPRSGKR
jgi:hypothetical protein